MASQPVIDAAARESRANAREDMAVLTSGAREKVDTAMASMQALGTKILHPMDNAKKEEADATAERQTNEAREKRDEIRSVAAQQSATERAAARSTVAKGVAETGGERYPVLVTDHPPPSSHPSQKQEAPDSGSHSMSSRQEGASEVGAKEAATEAPPPVSPPSRTDENRKTDGNDEAVEEGVEDADFYPPTRIVQT